MVSIRQESSVPGKQGDHVGWPTAPWSSPSPKVLCGTPGGRSPTMPTLVCAGPARPRQGHASPLALNPAGCHSTLVPPKKAVAQRRKLATWALWFEPLRPPRTRRRPHPSPGSLPIGPKGAGDASMWVEEGIAPLTLVSLSQPQSTSPSPSRKGCGHL